MFTDLQIQAELGYRVERASVRAESARLSRRLRRCRHAFDHHPGAGTGRPSPSSPVSTPTATTRSASSTIDDDALTGAGVAA